MLSVLFRSWYRLSPLRMVETLPGDHAPRGVVIGAQHALGDPFARSGSPLRLGLLQVGAFHARGAQCIPEAPRSRKEAAATGHDKQARPRVEKHAPPPSLIVTDWGRQAHRKTSPDAGGEQAVRWFRVRGAQSAAREVEG